MVNSFDRSQGYLSYLSASVCSIVEHLRSWVPTEEAFGFSHHLSLLDTFQRAVLAVERIFHRNKNKVPETSLTPEHMSIVVQPYVGAALE
jgi:hypothetical protein